MNKVLLTLAILVCCWAVYADNVNPGMASSQPESSIQARSQADSVSTKTPLPENFIFIEGGTIHLTDGSFSGGLTVASMYMDKYELTNAGWTAVIESGSIDNLPKVHVTWFDAIAFCNIRSMMEGLTPCYSYLSNGTNPGNWPYGWNTANNHMNLNFDTKANGYRLPTEAEWVYAARGGLQTHGYTYAGSNDLDEVGWFDGNSGDTTHPVGEKKPNEFGLYDMCGNVNEWCWDSWDGMRRVGRGGGFMSYAEDCIISHQHNIKPDYENLLLGFRVCRNVP